jgi:hypothetical protein
MYHFDTAIDNLIPLHNYISTLLCLPSFTIHHILLHLRKSNTNLNTSRSMGNNRPTPEPIIRITHLPTIRDRAQQCTLTTRAIRGTKHAQIMPVIFARTLIRQALHVRGIVVGFQGLAGCIIPARAMVDAHVDVGVIWVAGWDGGAEEAKVPL